MKDMREELIKWDNMLISPSILGLINNGLEQGISEVEDCADLIHLDVMDGKFVDPVTFSVEEIRNIKTKLKKDVHLMVADPKSYIKELGDCNIEYITVHFEACNDLSEEINLIKSLGYKVGIALRPGTNAEVLKKYIKDIDLVLVMTVEPGYGGQEFMEDMVEKVKDVRSLSDTVMIEVDGGINDKTAAMCFKAGANIFVAGSYIFKSEDRRLAIEKMRIVGA